MVETVRQTTKGSFFPVRLAAIATDLTLPYDVFLEVSGRVVLFRPRGEVITLKRLQSLQRHGAREFLIPLEQRDVFLGTLTNLMKNPDVSVETKSRVLKETAFVHVHDLFTQTNISPAIKQSESIVQEMVRFVSTDMGAVSSLMRLSVHDYYTYNHCVDVAVYAIALAKKVFGDDTTALFHAGMGGLLHDIGKRKISWDIINKKSPLNPQEWEEIRQHPTYGYDFLRESELVPLVAKQAVYEHHENFDGTGYPRGLAEDQIGILSRIITIADVFDALTTNRSYHTSVPPQEALKIMYSMQPGKFDPELFKSFNRKFDKKAPIELPHDFDPCQTAPTVDSEWHKKKAG